VRTFVSGKREAQGADGRLGGRTSSIRNGTSPTQAAPSNVSTSRPAGSNRWTASGVYDQWRKVSCRQCWCITGRRTSGGGGGWDHERVVMSGQSYGRLGLGFTTSRYGGGPARAPHTPLQSDLGSMETQ
jgi:hypothetical protein